MTTVLDTDGHPLREGVLVRLHPSGDLARVLLLPAAEVEPDDPEGPCGQVLVRYPLDSAGEPLALSVFARGGYAICPDLKGGRAHA